MTTVTTKVHFKAGIRGRCVLRAGPSAPPPPPGRVPRVARLMALAIRFERLIAEGGVTTQAELAELGHVTRARVTQIMNLLHLAPDIQEQILDLPEVVQGRDPITERDLRPIAAEIRWDQQRCMWEKLRRERADPAQAHTDRREPRTPPEPRCGGSFDDRRHSKHARCGAGLPRKGIHAGAADARSEIPVHEGLATPPADRA